MAAWRAWVSIGTDGSIPITARTGSQRAMAAENMPVPAPISRTIEPGLVLKEPISSVHARSERCGMQFPGW